jgi:hypothetical protein
MTRERNETTKRKAGALVAVPPCIEKLAEPAPTNSHRRIDPMPKREVRRYFLIYHSLGPMIAIGLIFTILLLAGSLLFSGIRAERMLGLSVVTFSVSALVGLGHSAIMLWKTRNLQ